jgi:hypothetical protein
MLSSRTVILVPASARRNGAGAALTLRPSEYRVRASSPPGCLYIYTVTDTFPNFSTQFSFTQPTLASSGFVTSRLTQISGATATAFSWNSVAGGLCFGAAGSGFACAAVQFGNVITLVDFFQPGSFLAPGTYTGGRLS